MDGKVLDIGDGALSDGGDCDEFWLFDPVPVELVVGRSLPGRAESLRACRKALYTDAFEAGEPPNVVELSLT